MLLAMELFPYLRSDGIGLPLLRRGGRQQVLFGLLITLAAGLVLVTLASASAWSVGKWTSKRLGGVTGDVYGAVNEITEALVLVVAAFLTWGAPSVLQSPLYILFD